ncbi:MULTISPECIES: stage III sporulation protein AC [Alteribacter]|uniref:Stage III sporulation protein AC n=1 Tax=Alteribacter keqinensis TaxID=2483800 RepID=A0A3M7TU54_9BACI|nr:MULTISPECIES: stage III sporulation protein AC [Alteribacter]MBM7097292.1 stage III sporulation protein AC [Alteribacter salitolerans]RNA68973.1 stage III sporulation protein AC [Alteribacter keqinensis]
MNYDISLIFQIAGVGIVVAMMHTVLKQMGKDDMAQWVTLVAFVVVLYMVASVVDDLFQTIRSVFLFQG